MTITNDDARMVAERLGLTADDADEVRQALIDAEAVGFDHYLDQMISENANALQAAEGGEQPTDAVLRRTAVRKRIAERYAEFIALREHLANSDGTTHY
jgi:hypothetical protein